MANANTIIYAKFQAFDNDGHYLIGGRLYTYAAGTDIEKNTYSDYNRTVPNTNPIVLDARGEATAFGDGERYKLVLKDANDALIITIDNVTEINGLKIYSSIIISNYCGCCVRPEDFGAEGDGVTDDTVAVQEAFYAAQEANTIVFLCKQYAVSDTLLFGDQEPFGDSGAGIVGNGWHTGFKAVEGCTGTVLQAQNCQHIRFENFLIDANNIAETCFDSSWLGGVGPSVQNKYERIRCTGATGTTWIASDNNDCVFDQVICVGTDIANQNQIGIDLSAPGGLVWVRDCVWSYSYLKFRSQNGRIENSWGHGILFGGACLNFVSLDGCYIYGNKTLNACLKSDSFDPQQSVRSLICNTTQFTTPIPYPDAYCDLNLYSIADFNGCQFIGETPTLFGDNTRSDSYDVVRAKIRGGSYDSSVLTLNEPTGFVLEIENLMDDYTGNAYRSYERMFNPVLIGSATAGTGTYTGQTGSYRLNGNMVEYEVDIAWTNHTGTGQMQITGFPLVQIGQTGAIIGYTGNTFGETVVVIIVNSNVASVWNWDGTPFNVTNTGNIAISGNYKV